MRPTKEHSRSDTKSAKRALNWKNSTTTLIKYEIPPCAGGISFFCIQYKDCYRIDNLLLKVYKVKVGKLNYLKNNIEDESIKM